MLGFVLLVNKLMDKFSDIKHIIITMKPNSILSTTVLRFFCLFRDFFDKSQRIISDIQFHSPAQKKSPPLFPLVQCEGEKHQVEWGENLLHTKCIRDLDKLNLVKLGYGGLDLGSIQFSLLPPLLMLSVPPTKKGWETLVYVFIPNFLSYHVYRGFRQG